MNYPDDKNFKYPPTPSFGSLLQNYYDGMDAMSIQKLLGAFENDAERGVGIHSFLK